MTTDDINLDIWQRVARPPETALKKIVGGRLAGMTDINPQWRLKAMTEVFGPCGVGWKWAIDKLWTESGPSGEVMAFALVNVWIWDTSIADVPDWSAPIPGIGGSALVAKESSGLRANDEAYKMAVTDALSVALKCLGVASDIYERKYDGSKYTEPSGAPALTPPRRLSERNPTNGGEANPNVGKPPLELTGDTDPLLTKTELAKLLKIFKDAAVSTEAIKTQLATLGVGHSSELRQSHLARLVAWAQQKEVA